MFCNFFKHQQIKQQFELKSKVAFIRPSHLTSEIL
jgi:hypothetical protein